MAVLSVVVVLLLIAGTLFYLASMRAAMAELRMERDRTRTALRDTGRANRETRETLEKANRAEQEARAALTAATAANQRTREALDSLTNEEMERLLSQRSTLSDEDRKFLDKLRGIYEELGRQYGDTREARLIRAKDGPAWAACTRGSRRATRRRTPSIRRSPNTSGCEPSRRPNPPTSNAS